MGSVLYRPEANVNICIIIIGTEAYSIISMPYSMSIQYTVQYEYCTFIIIGTEADSVLREPIFSITSKEIESDSLKNKNI